MSYLKRIQYHILVAILTAVIFFPNIENVNKNSNILAWWGTIYPQFCFMEMPEEGKSQEAKPRFHFWIAETIKDLM